MNLLGAAMLPLYCLLVITYPPCTRAEYLFPDIGPMMVKCGDHQCDLNTGEYCNYGIDSNSPDCESCSNTYGRQHLVRDTTIANERCPLYILKQKEEDAQSHQTTSTGTSTVMPDCRDQQGLSKSKIILINVVVVVSVSLISVVIIWCCLRRKYKKKLVEIRKGHDHHDGEQWTASNAETMAMLGTCASCASTHETLINQNSSAHLPKNGITSNAPNLAAETANKTHTANPPGAHSGSSEITSVENRSSNDRTRQNDDKDTKTPPPNHQQTACEDRHDIGCLSPSTTQHYTSESRTTPTHHILDTLSCTNEQNNSRNVNTPPEHIAQRQTGSEDYTIDGEVETSPKHLAQSDLPHQSSPESLSHSNSGQAQQNTHPSETDGQPDDDSQVHGQPDDDSQGSYTYMYNFRHTGTYQNERISEQGMDT